ncbi:MAG: hypothetical protein ACFFB3_14710 [Candidatus Hodarchaeota archaeon]
MDRILFPILYNMFFFIVLAAWLNKEKLEIRIRINNLTLWLISGLYTIIAIIINILMVVYDLTDVDNALWTGSEAFVKGINPYTNEVVEHIDTNGESFLSYYNYGPVNLVVYSIFFVLFGPLFDEWWLFPTSFILGVACYFTHGAMRGKAEKLVTIGPEHENSGLLIAWNHRRDLPLFCMLLSPFLVNNSILMLLFFMIGRYFRQRGYKTAEVSFYVLGAEVKFMTGLIVVIMYLDQIRSRDLSWKAHLPYFTGVLVYILSALPFDFYAVIRGELLQQGVPSERTGQIAGPMLVEILLFFEISDLLIPIALIILMFTYWITIKRPLPDREIIICLISLFLLPFYGTELAIVPFALIIFNYTGILRAEEFS